MGAYIERYMEKKGVEKAPKSLRPIKFEKIKFASQVNPQSFKVASIKTSLIQIYNPVVQILTNI